MASIQDSAQALGITTEVLFERAYKMFGSYLSPSGTSAADYAWWKKWNTEPLYVRKYLKHQESRNRLPVVQQPPA